MKRGKPGANHIVSMDVPQMDKHEKMASEMHDAIYQMQDKMRKPYPRTGSKLLPAKLQSTETPESKMARAHIEKMHAAMKDCKSD